MHDVQSGQPDEPQERRLRGHGKRISATLDTVVGKGGAKAKLANSRPNARVVLLTGPSGCGKSRLASQSGLPKLPLDDFYFDHDHPGLPRRFGIVDWDSPETWDAAGAMAALESLCTTGRATVPVYSIPTSSRIGEATSELMGAPLVIAEGIFAAELVKRCSDAGLLADAICLTRPRLVSFWFRLVRDLQERRKPVFTLIRRGVGLCRGERKQIAHWVQQGCHPLGKRAAIARIAALAHGAS